MNKHAADLMSPDASPGQPAKHAGVRRVNNLPVYIVLAGLAVVLIIMALVASDRSARQNRPPEPNREEQGGSTAMFAKEVAGEQQAGLVTEKSANPPAIPAIETAPPPAPELPPQAPAPMPAPPAAAQQPNPAAEEASRIRIMKLQQFDEAVRARSSVNLGGARAGTGIALRDAGDTAARLAVVRQQLSAGPDDTLAAYQARLQLLQGGAAQGEGADRKPPDTTGAAPSAGSAAGKSLYTFAGTGQGDRWRLDSRPEAPRTPYELRTGFVIPATLLTGINSDLPGQINAQVSQDVYDTALGKYKLIPQGARLVGTYSSELVYGQSRVLVAWQRIIFPDGRAMDIGAMPGVDSAGYSGLTDQVNAHYLRLFSSAFLMSGITAGIAMTQRDSTAGLYGRPSAGTALSEALGQQLGMTTAQLISKNLNIAPTLEIRPGYRLNVTVTKDLTFSRPYVPFDY